MKPSPNITVVGSINMDLVFRTPRMPAVGETISGHEFVQIKGGKGANQAVAAARQGAVTTLIACVGNDAYGQQSLSGLHADDIVTDFISIINHCATGVAGIFVDDSGHNSIVIAPGANAQLSPSHIDAAKHAISSATLLLCQCETPLATVSAAIQIAHEHGVKVVFNPAPAIPLPDALLAKVSYLIVNETEAEQLSGIKVTNLTTAQTASKNLLNRGAACVLLTMGEQGVCITEQHNSQHIPAIKVTVIDTTAAGDTFVGAFATAIGLGLSTIEAAKQAQYSAALTVTKLGAQSSIPTKAEVERFMVEQLKV
ncbi:ribokinase [Solimicrobium silvestre]|uniref:Ribokinase n=1 Tax=Solimicrobium silvestre TaxID=2099400 RepID=A0A2S9GUG1_9BURK|nr:ribokinase [Solimicrobium silvestre]PRC91367.1 Ribokinase [Solimicrobium silvestre]